MSERKIIPNDCNLFAQAEVEGAFAWVTSDARSKTLYDALQEEFGLTFQFMDIRENLKTAKS